MLTILVTGGTGFIGSNFILQARSKNWANIINLDKLTDSCNPHTLAELQNDAGYAFVRGDSANRELLNRILDRYQPYGIVHFAAESHVDRSILSPANFIQTNIVGTYEQLEACKAYWQNLSEPRRSQFRFVQISTDEVYGSLSSKDLPFTEISPYRPNSPYAGTKASADASCEPITRPTGFQR